MGNNQFNTSSQIDDLQFLILELEKNQPDSKIIKLLTNKYGIPYHNDLSEQLDELLNFLNSLKVRQDKEI